MARLAFFTALAVAAAVVLGCGPAKELPDEIPKGPDSTEQAPAVPRTSDPAAKAYIEKAVKAYTGAKPDLVAKGKASRLVLKGHQYKLDGVPVWDATRSISAAWPDKIAVKDERQAVGNVVRLSAYLNRPRLTIMAGTVERTDLPNIVEMEKNFAAEETAQHWMPLFLPLTDPKAVVFDLRAQTLSLQPGQTIPVQTLKLSLADFPLYQLTFDAKTDALLRVDYTVMHVGVSHAKQWNMAAHKTGPEGLLLPTKMEYKMDSQTGEEWEAEKWEFPATIPEEEFSPPQPK